MQETLFWIEKFVAIALLQQTAEFLFLRKSFSDEGVWRWSTLRRDYLAWPDFIQRILGFIWSQSGYRRLLWMQATLSAALLLSERAGFLSPFLFVTSFLVAARWRGSFNGGSDFMTSTILLTLSVAEFFKSSDVIVHMCLWYLAFQTVLSFFISGIVKIKEPDWRNGNFLRTIPSWPQYSVPASFAGLIHQPQFAFFASWTVIGFECLFPLALLNESLAVVFISFAVLFQISNAFVFGLNRFLFAWAAAYPAIIFLAGR